MTTVKLDPRISHAKFSVSYDGAALRDGSMDVRDLAPALLALGSLCEEANKALNGGHADVAIKVKAVERGSFLVSLDVLQELKGLFTGADNVDADSILKFLGLAAGASVGVLKLRRWLKGKPIKGTVLKDGSVQVNVNIDGDHNTVLVAPQAKKLYEANGVQQELKKAVRPLHAPGIDTLRFLQDGDIVDTVREDELDAFTADQAAEDPEDETLEYEGTYRLDRVTFADDLRTWTFSGPNLRFTARIADEQFLDQVQNGAVTFASGDRLHVRVRQRIRTRGQVTSSFFTILQVIRHHPAPRQKSMLADQGPIG